MAEKPAVLIIGGLGYIGRFLALYIHKNNLASEVRIVDKVLPQLAWLAPEFEEACAKDKFMQADASKQRMCCTYFLLPYVVKTLAVPLREPEPQTNPNPSS
jgi:nucleoside-diphosphate-sugar epimerase